MRFLPEGPDIPDELLNRRDEGKVVFLCGAGVSKEAGLPDFEDLTEHVINELLVEKDEDSIAYKIWKQEPKRIDEVFQALKNEYSRQAINHIITNKLSPNEDGNPNIKAHKTIAKISADINRKPQIITTNFDRLFEEVNEIKKSKCRVAPNFPDLNQEQLPHVTYLHGRLPGKEGNDNHKYVLSSADFGLAYLAENRAVHFFLELLKSHTVVLLGYQANDPPIKFLLQGLKDANRLEPKQVFVFDQGQPKEIEAIWWDRGVTTIAYNKDNHGDGHHNLWNTLDVWAKRAYNPNKWRGSVARLARKKPKGLSPHQRGQVCHLVSTAEGARQFADAPNTPPAEWLCVFDGEYRKNNEEYYLDNDSNCDIENDDLLAWKEGDDTPTHSFRLIDPTRSGNKIPPERLWHLIDWIAKMAPSDPVVAWWIAGASKHGHIHPRLLDQISISIKYAKSMPKLGHQVWDLLLEYLEQDDAQLHERKWYDKRGRIKFHLALDNPPTFILRVLERTTEPALKIERSYDTSQSKPPIGRWQDLEFHQIVPFSVDFHNFWRKEEKIKVLDKNSPIVFEILERNLIKGVNKLEEIGQTWLLTPTLYQDEEEGADCITSGSSGFILWFVKLFNQLSDFCPKIAKIHVKTWPIEEPLIFNKLRLYAWNKPNLFTPSEVVEMLLEMEPDSFWESKNDREFLFLLRDRWESFDTSQRERLLNRLLYEPTE